MAGKKIQGITAKLGLDATGVTTALNDIDKQARTISQQMKEVDKGLKLDPTSMGLAAQKMELLQSAITNTEKKLQELESVSEKAGKALANNDKWEEKYKPLEAEINEVTQKLKDLRKAEEDTKKDLEEGKISPEQYEAYKNEVEETKNKLKELKNAKKDLEAEFADGHISADEYRAYEIEVEQTRAALANLRQQQEQAARGAEQLGDAVEQSSEDLAHAESNVKSYENALKDLNDAAGKVGNDIKGIVSAAAGAVTAIGAAGVGAIKEATNVGMTFEAAMSKVQAISGASAADMELLEEAAKQAGKTTSKSASESADALSYMALAGWDTTQMLNGLMPILRASEAGAMDLATASDLITDSMSAMGVGVDGLGHYLDVLTAAQNNSNTSMQQLLEAFVVCGGTAHNMGIDVEQLSTILGTMANRGIKGSEAGTALNSVLVNMLGTTKRTADTMDALGLSMFDEAGNAKNITEVLKEMEAALSDCTDEQKAMYEANLGGKTQMDALQAVVSGVGDEYDKLAEALTNADGAMLDTAGTMQNNLAGSVTAMQSALEGLGIDVYSHFQQPFTEAVQEATRQIGGLSSAVTDGKLAGTLEALAGKLGEVAKKAAAFAANEGIPKLIDALDWIVTNGDKAAAILLSIGEGWATWKITGMAMNVMNLVKAVKEFQAAAATATVEQKALNAAMEANIYALVAAAIVTVVSALANLAIAAGEAKLAEEKHNREIDDTTKAILAETDALKKNNEETRQSIKEIDDRAEIVHELWGELQSLVDEEGKVIEDEEKVKELTKQINAIAGTNIEVTGGQIQAYDGLCQSIDKYIEKKKAEAKVNYLASMAGEAEYKLAVAQRNYNENLDKWNEAVRQADQKREIAAVYRSNGLKKDADRLEKEAEDILLGAADYRVAASAYADEVEEYKGIIDDYDKAIRESTEITLPNFDEDTAKSLGMTISTSVAEGAAAAGGDVGDAVADSVTSAYDDAVAAGKSVGAAAADAIQDAMAGGMEGSELNSTVRNYIDEIKLYAKENNMGDSWLYSEIQKVVDILPQGTELYRKYRNEVLDGEAKIKKASENGTKSTAGSAAGTAASGITDEVVKGISGAYDKAIEGGKSVGEASAAAIKEAMSSDLKDSELNGIINDYFADLKIYAKENGKGDTWLYAEMRKITDILPKNSDAYRKYYNEILDGEKKLSKESEDSFKAAAKAGVKAVGAVGSAIAGISADIAGLSEDAGEAAEGAASDAEKAFSDAAKRIQDRINEIDSRTEKFKTGVKGIFTKDDSGKLVIDASGIKKKVDAKLELNGLIDRLIEAGCPAPIIDELLSIDPVEAVEYAKMLLKNPKKLDNIKKLGEQDEEVSRKLAIKSLGEPNEYLEAGAKAGAAFAGGILSGITNVLPNLTALPNMLKAPETAGAASTEAKAEGTDNKELNETNSKQLSVLESMYTLIAGLTAERSKNGGSSETKINITLDGESITDKMLKILDSRTIVSGE